MKSRDLPLHWFDRIFRTLGSLLLFVLWGVRAAWARLFPRHVDQRSNLVFVPAALYAVQALLRLGIYQLHAAGAWARACCVSGHMARACCVYGIVFRAAAGCVSRLLRWPRWGGVRWLPNRCRPYALVVPPTAQAGSSLQSVMPATT